MCRNPTSIRWLLLGLTASGALAACGLPETVPEYPVLIPPRTITPTGEVVEPDGPVRKGYFDHARSPEESLVQLWCWESYFAPTFAVHPYFLCFDAESGRWERWEIWAGDSFGTYVEERATKIIFSGGREPLQETFRHRQIGAVRSWAPITYINFHGDHLLGQWGGGEAADILAVLRRPEAYPRRNGYSIWPGPNSNSYPRWVLSTAGVGFDLDPRMVGKDWYGPLGFGVGLSPTRTGLHLDLLSFGATAGLLDGVEVHFLGGTLGIDLWPPALKTPLGRLGF